MSNDDFSSSVQPAEPIAQPLAYGDLGAAPLDASAPPLVGAASAAINPLHQVKATVTVTVGSASVTVGELLAAKQAQVLKLDRAVDDVVDLVLEGQVVARGQLVAVGEHFGIRITELPRPLDV